MWSIELRGGRCVGWGVRGGGSRVGGGFWVESGRLGVWALNCYGRLLGGSPGLDGLLMGSCGG